MANWWDEAYSDIAKWSVNSDQLNKDRGAYKDAFQMNAAEKGLNYELTSKLMDRSTDQEKGMMQLSADLDRRNTLDLMTGEHNFKMAGMQEANRLSKDYLSAEGRETRATIGETGYQERLKQDVVNRGATEVAGIQGSTQRDVASTEAGAARYGADRSLQAAEAQAGAQRYGYEQQRQGATEVAGIQGSTQRDVASTEADAARYGADRSLQAAQAQAGAQRYGYEQQRQGATEVAGIQGSTQRDVANTEAGASRYGADRSLQAAEAQAFAQRYVSEQQRQGAESVANTEAGAARDVESIRGKTQLGVTETEGRTARDLANIQGGYGLQNTREQQEGETRRTGMGLASQERQIGLTGRESRRTIETQGEQSRRNIETEGEQARRNIRETGGEERRTYSYQRDTDADRAVRMSRR
jgi:hypothetical protein